MRLLITATLVSMLTTLAFSQNNSNFSNGQDYFIQKKNLVVEQSLYVLKNFELSGTLKSQGISYFGSKVSIGSFSEPTETLDVFGNMKTRGFVYAENFNVSNSGQISQNLTIDNNLNVLNNGYFGKIGINKTGVLTESLEVVGNALVSDEIRSNSILSTYGSISGDWAIGGLLNTQGTATFNSNILANANIGVGVSVPGERIDVSGNIRASQSLLSETVATQDLNTNTATVRGTFIGEGKAYFRDEVFITGNTSLSNNLQVEGSQFIGGNLGIGVDAPVEKLEVLGNSKVSGTMQSSRVEAPFVLTNTISSEQGLNIQTNTNITDNLNVGGLFIVDGIAVMNSSLGIGKTPDEKLDVLGNALISDNLTANSINTQTFAAGDIEVENSLNVQGSTSLQNTLTVSGQSTFEGNVNALGNSIVNGNLGVGTASPGEKLDVVGNARISQALSADQITSSAFTTNDLGVNNTLNVKGPSTLESTLSVSGSSAFGQNATFQSNVQVAGNSTVSGNVGIGTAAPSEKLDVVGNAKISQALSANQITTNNFTANDLAINNTLNVKGAASLENSLSVLGASTFQNNVNISGNSMINGNLGIGTSGAASEKLDVIGNTKISQNLTIGNNATVAQQLVVNGKIGVGKQPVEAFDIIGNVKASGSIEAAQLKSESLTLNNATVDQNLEVKGTGKLATLEVINQSTLKSDLTVDGKSALKGQVAIGKEVPTSELDVAGNALISGSVKASSLESNTLKLANLQPNANATSFLVMGADGGIYSRSLDEIVTTSGGDGGVTNNISFVTQTLSIGTNDTPEGFSMAVDGGILTSELTIELANNWPDYVFDETYDLKNLAEVEQFINENKHLPDVPSSADVQENGINVGEMNAQLLKKIEELTLYLIDQQKEIDELKSQMMLMNTKSTKKDR